MTQREVFYDFLDTYLDTSDRAIIEIIKNNNLYISDLSLADILINYSISIARNMAGHPLDTVFEDFEIFKNTKEYHTVLDLSRVAKEHFDVDFNDSEKSFLTLMLICKGSTHDKIY